MIIKINDKNKWFVHGNNGYNIKAPVKCKTFQNLIKKCLF